MTKTQRELLAKMQTGRKVTIYRDDPRTVLHSKDMHPAGCERGIKWTTVVALLNAGKIRIVTNEADRHCSTNGKRIGGSTTYEAV